MEKGLFLTKSGFRKPHRWLIHGGEGPLVHVDGEEGPRGGLGLHPEGLNLAQLGPDPSSPRVAI
jgi:hypothetical protein